MYERLGIQQGFIEANMFQTIYAEHFKDKTSINLKGNTVTHNDKVSLVKGIPSLRTMFEHQKFRFPYKTEEAQKMTNQIFSELNGVIFKDGKLGNFKEHDDCVLALWHMVCAGRTGVSNVTMVRGGNPLKGRRNGSSFQKKRGIGPRARLLSSQTSITIADRFRHKLGL